MYKETLLKMRVKDHQLHTITGEPYEKAQDILNQMLAMPLGDFVAMVEGRFAIGELLEAVEAENREMKREDRRAELKGMLHNKKTPDAIEAAAGG